MSGCFGESRQAPRHKSVEWYTPQWVFDALAIRFDLDPCSPHDFESFVPAAKKLTVFDDGLSSAWSGKVFLNPPYGRDTVRWMDRMCAHGDGIALVFSRTDAGWFQRALASADAVLFVRGRISFVAGIENSHKKAGAGAGTAMFAWSRECVQALERLSDRGVLIRRQAIRAVSC